MAFSFGKAGAPASLSINTTSANSTFGSSTANQQPATSSASSSNMLFPGFGTNQGGASSTSGTLFGPPKTSAPSLFSTPAPQPAQTGFGGLGQTPADQNKQNQTPNLFGGLGSVPQPSNNLFNNSQQQQQPQQQQQQSNLFNSLNQKPAETNLFSGLGQTEGEKQQQQQQAAQPQPFGATTFGGLSFGQSKATNPQTQTVPGVKINLDNLRPTTRFNDLHEELQKVVEAVDNHIQRQMQQKHDCASFMPMHEELLSAIPNDVDFLTRQLNDVENVLASDAEGIFQAKQLVQTDIDAAKLSFRAIDNLKLPHQFQQLGPWSGSTGSSAAANNAELSSSLPKFFMKEADKMLATLEVYEKNMSQIEAHLRDVEARTAHQFIQSQSRARNEDPDESFRELGAAFRDFEHGIHHVAGKVAGLKDEVDQIKRGGLLSDVGFDGSRSTRRGGVY